MQRGETLDFTWRLRRDRDDLKYCGFLAHKLCSVFEGIHLLLLLFYDYCFECMNIERWVYNKYSAIRINRGQLLWPAACIYKSYPLPEKINFKNSSFFSLKMAPWFLRCDQHWVASLFWLVAYIGRLFDSRFSLVYFLKPVKFPILAREMCHNVH